MCSVTAFRRALTEPAEAQFEVFLRGLLERLRTRGAISHEWLRPYLFGGGRRWQVWGGRPDGMPAFPRGLAAPRFLISAAPSRSEFDTVSGRDTWYADWAHRCLGLPRDQAPGYLAHLLPALATAGIVASCATESGAQVYGLQPGHVMVTRLSDVEAPIAGAPVSIVCGAARRTPGPGCQVDWAGMPAVPMCVAGLRRCVDERGSE